MADVGNLKYVVSDTSINMASHLTGIYVVDVFHRLTMCANTTRTHRYAPQPLSERLRLLILRLPLRGMASAFLSWASRDSLISCKYVSTADLCATQSLLNSILHEASHAPHGHSYSDQGAGSEGADRSAMEGSGTGDIAAGAKSGAASNGSNPDAKNIDGKDASSSSGNSSADGGSGGILLNSGTRIGMGLKLGLVHFAEDVEGDEWRMSVQNSARRSSGVPDSPFDSIFQLRAALIPTFPVDFDSNTTTPSSSTPYIPTPTTPYIPINPEEVMSVLHALEEKAEDSDGEKEEERFGDRPSEVPNSASMSIATSGLCSPIGTGGISLTDTVSEQSLRASLASRAARSRRAS